MTIDLGADRAVKFEGKKEGGRYQAIAVTGGGSIEGLSVSLLDGSAAHGNRVRIEADASYAIGPKTQAAPRHWEMGGDVRVDGSPITPTAIGSTPSTGSAWLEGRFWDDPTRMIVANSELRHARADRYYEVRVNGDLGSPASFGTQISKANGKKITHWMRVQANQDWSQTRVINISGSITGTFDYPGDVRRRGEQCVIENGAGTVTENVYILYVYNDGVDTWIAVEPIGFEWGAGAANGTDDFFGGTITGNASGATATFGSQRKASPSAKMWRINQDRALDPNMYSTYSALSSGQYFYRASDGTGALQGESIYPGGSPQDHPEQWSYLGITIDCSGATREDALYSNNSLIYTRNDLDTQYYDNNPTNQGMHPGIIGFDTGRGPEQGISCHFGEIYIDTDTRILFLCDAPTFAGSTEIEPQLPEAWTEDADGGVTIDAELYQGAFSSFTGKYLALIDGPSVAFEGLEVPA